MTLFNFFHLPLGRTLVPSSMRVFVMLLSLILCSHVAYAKTKLDPDNINTSLNYKSSSFTSNHNGYQVKVYYKGCGTFYDAGDWNGFNSREFHVINAHLTADEPYIELAFVGYDHDGVGLSNDQTYSNGFWIKYAGENNYRLVAVANESSKDIENKDVDNYGVVTKVKKSDDDNKMEHHHWRYYPAVIDQAKQITSVRFVSYVDNGDNGGSSNPSYGYTSKSVDYMFVYEIPIVYDFSTISGKDKVNEQPNGQVSFTATNVPVKAIATQSNRGSWSSGHHAYLDNINVDWNPNNSTFAQYINKQRIAEEKIAYKVSDSKATGSSQLNNVRYNAVREYVLKHRLERQFEVGTNGYDKNHLLTVKQKLYYDEVVSTLDCVMYPTELKANPEMWNKSVTLVWKVPTGTLNDKGSWYVFRYPVSEGPESRTLLTPSGLGANVRQYTDTDVPEYDKGYVYEVSFGLRDWGILSMPEPTLTETTIGGVVRNITLTLNSIEKLEKDSVSDGLRLTWSHPAMEKDVTFVVERKEGTSGSFAKIAEVKRTSKEAQQHTYTDKTPSNACETYYYRIKATVLDKEFESNVMGSNIAGGSRIRSLKCSKGTYANMVKVQWDVQQVGDETTQFDLLRRQLGTNGSFSEIYTTQGTLTNYYFEDNTAQPGNYYEYKVEAYAICGETYRLANEITDDGFSQATGIISGRVTYGTGVAVSDAKVILTQSSEETSKEQFYALNMHAMGAGVEYQLTNAQADELFAADKAVTIQCWVHPSSLRMVENGGEQIQTIFATEDMAVNLYSSSEIAGKFQLQLQHSPAGGKFTATRVTDIYIPTNEYTHLTFTRHADKMTFRVVDNDTIVRQSVSYTATTPIRTLRFGCPLFTDMIAEQSYVGHMDEIRVWGTELTDKALLGNYNRLLSGTEDGLKIYWPLDEGINNQVTAYDYSKTGGVPNECHGTILMGTEPDTNIPTPRQLSLFGLTDGEGNYVIRGIPFSGDGTNYVVTPEQGIHKFSPAYSTRFVSANSINHSAVDFEDVSSFPVRGKVYYEHTDYPVEGAYLYVDDMLCSRNGAPVMTAADGSFEISVPIGDHYIKVEKQGHTFVNNGRYPADPDNIGTLATFESEWNNLTFYDNTLVTIAGRVVGGTRESDYALGFGLSKNNIGQATIKLSTGNNTYRMNVDVGDFSIEDGKANRIVESPTNDVKSTAWRQGAQSAATSNDDVRYIFIKTDSLTGEFAALLPPIAYQIEDISIAANADVNFDLSDYGVLDATNPLITITDSLKLEDGTKKEFTYTAVLHATYRNKPIFTVTDTSNEIGAWGEKTYTYTDPQGIDTTLTIYEERDGKVHYFFDYPIFVEHNKYTFLLHGYEEYVNKDGLEAIYDYVPLAGTIVTIANQMSNTQEVYVEGENEGEFHGEVKENELRLDSIGQAIYTFQVGFPNITGDFTRTMNITYQNNGQTVAWDGNDTFKGIIIGNLPSGSNFVTAGPDQVLMVLRDPPGSNSSAYWEQGTSIAHNFKVGGGIVSENRAETVTHFGLTNATIVGTPGVGIITPAKTKADMTVGLGFNFDIVGSQTTTVKTTTTQRIQTSDDPSYVGSASDVFIGSSTNILFGNARAIDFQKGTDGQYSIQLQEIMVAGSEFTTAFSYTQWYIENVLIPNMYALRNNLIISVSEGEYNTFVNNTNHTLYISTLAKEDERFGSSNFDRNVWNDKAVDKSQREGPSYKMLEPNQLIIGKVYTDSVLWYNEQIEYWTNILRDNERMKLQTITERSTYLDKNISFDAGVVIENSVEELDFESVSVAFDFDILAVFGLASEATISGVGVSGSIKTETGGTFGLEDSNDTENTDTRGYIMADDGINDALTVDIFKAPDNLGPIFSTRGGQTSCPYEGAVVTKYYSPGETLSAATMQVEIPEISVTNAFATDIPSGGKATFELHLANLSEIGSDVWFDLALDDDSNPYGAMITMDGSIITDGRSIKVAAGQVLVKTIQLTQTDESVLDYENIRLVLKSQCQGKPWGTYLAIADTVAINAHFVPSCSPITLTIEERTLNLLTGDVLEVNLSDFNRSYRNFKGLRLQYKYANDAEWSLAQEFVLNSEDVTSSNMLLPEGMPVTYQFDMSNTAIYPDGKYTFRVITMCEYGNDMIHNESEAIEVVKDMVRPQVLGSAQPSNGILTADDDIYVTFNESIRSGMLTDANNFIITGALNGTQIDHNVALQLHVTEEVTAQTEAPIAFSNKDFAADMWVRLTSSGTIWEHGTADARFTVGVDEMNHLVLKIGEAEYISENVVPMDKWIFLSFNYTYQANSSLFSASVAYDANTVDLFTAASVADYENTGRLTIGKHIEGAIHELALWNVARSTTTSQAEMHFRKSAATPNLIGYWKMNEGTGAIAKDVARNRHMQTAGNWALNNKNFAAALQGDSYLELNISACSARTTDDYALELWFQGGAQEKATIFAIPEDSLKLYVNAEGRLAILMKDKETLLGTADYLDGAWHHFALNVLRNGVAIVYIDGENVQQLSVSDVPALQGDAIIVGASRITEDGVNTYRDYFTGAVDEVRYWQATLTGKVIADNRYTCIDTAAVAGLAAYYPFETRSRDTYGQWVTTFDLKDVCTDIVAKDVNVIEAASAPALREAPAVDNLQFSYTASDTQIFIELLDAPARLEGTTVSFTLRNVRDLNNNLMQPIVWTAFVRQNKLVWSDDALALSTSTEEDITKTIQITNQSGTTEQWYLVSVPSWLNVSAEEGSLRPLASKQLTFTVDPATPYGTYEETIYLTGNDGIYEPLLVTLRLSAPEPTWKDDLRSANFEHSMNIIGQLRIDGKVADDTADQLAAFVDGQCVGVASPVYYERYDAYYIYLDIYGNDATIGHPITFRVWDATTGDIYAAHPESALTFTPNQLIGELQTPFLWEAKEQKEQVMQLNSGWNWMSLYVQPEDASLNSLFADTRKIKLVKDQTTFATYHLGKFAGSLNELTVGKLYKIQATLPTNLYLYGKALTLAEHPLTILPNWNWIGYNASIRMSLNDAFAPLVPEEGDVVKGQRGFSIYQDYEWVGTLQALEPGVGYMYQSKAQQEKIFTYPTVTVHNAERTTQYAPAITSTTFTPVEPNKYAGTMTMIAIVKNGEEQIMTAEVGVFAGHECRGAISLNADGIAFLNIHGEGYGEKLTCKAIVNEELYEVDLNLTFVEDAMHGTMEKPYVIQLDGTTKIENINFEELGNTRIYSTTGAYIGTAANNLPQGVYIVGGKKVFLSHKREINK